jgi:hypothetical protein
LLNGSFNIRGPNGQFYAMTWANVVDPAAAQANRSELVRYDSAVWHGFILSSMVAEAGDYWGSSIRYAGEYNGFRLAGAFGFDRVTDVATPAVVDPTAANFTGPAPNITVWGGGLSAMHVPTGLFVQGHYNKVDFGGTPGAASLYWGQSTASDKKDATQWLIQAGWGKNVFGYGQTTVYGEYGTATDWGADNGAAGRTYTTAGFTTVTGVTNTNVDVWGLGITQNIDAAATTLYLGYRHMDADIKCATVNCGGVAGSTNFKLSTEAIDVVVMGARVLF